MAIALIDDDQSVRRAVARFLRACGHHVLAYESSEAYLGQNDHADCVIVDIQLPGINGFELEQHMRREQRRGGVVFITAHDDAVTRAAADRTRWQLLRKPFDDDELLAAIAAATEPPRSGD
jgi:FixJ family two-component response regulator